MNDDKPVFIDGGYHQGEGLREFTALLGLDASWDVFAFEPNPACHRYFPTLCQHGWHYSPKAVWTAEGMADMRLENWQQSGSGSPVVDARNVVDGWASTLMATNQHAGLEGSVAVPTFDLAAFLKRLAGRQVILKLDVEGAEFPVLRHLLALGALGLLDELYVEFHERLLADESPISRAALQAECEKHVTLKIHG